MSLPDTEFNFITLLQTKKPPIYSILYDLWSPHRSSQTTGVMCFSCEPKQSHSVTFYLPSSHPAQAERPDISTEREGISRCWAVTQRESYGVMETERLFVASDAWLSVHQSSRLSRRVGASSTSLNPGLAASLVPSRRVFSLLTHFQFSWRLKLKHLSQSVIHRISLSFRTKNGSQELGCQL